MIWLSHYSQVVIDVKHSLAENFMFRLFIGQLIVFEDHVHASRTKDGWKIIKILLLTTFSQCGHAKFSRVSYRFR